MKKTLLIVISFILALITLVSCANPGSDNSTAAGSSDKTVNTSDTGTDKPADTTAQTEAATTAPALLPAEPIIERNGYILLESKEFLCYNSIRVRIAVFTSEYTYYGNRGIRIDLIDEDGSVAQELWYAGDSNIYEKEINGKKCYLIFNENITDQNSVLLNLEYIFLSENAQENGRPQFDHNGIQLKRLYTGKSVAAKTQHEIEVLHEETREMVESFVDAVELFSIEYDKYEFPNGDKTLTSEKAEWINTFSYDHIVTLIEETAKKAGL